MSLSEILIRIGGVVLFLVGLSLILSAVGINFLGATFINPLWGIVAGFILVGAGIYIVRGGALTV